MRIYTHNAGAHYVNALHAFDDPRHGLEYQIVSGAKVLDLRFQGAGVDAVFNEQLLATLIHRIGVLQDRWPCEENVHVLAHLRESLRLLECRERQEASPQA